MPEYAEVRIMKDFINHCSHDKVFTKFFDVSKGNLANESFLINNFKLEAKSLGKGLYLRLYHDVACFNYSVFMGMSGNWKFVKTQNWNDTKYIRMRFDTNDGYSLLLYGSYMGPKYKLGEFTGVKRGPDPVNEFDRFKNNIFSNLGNNNFKKPIPEVLLNQSYFNGIGAYLCSEILGRLDYNPFIHFNELSTFEMNRLINVTNKCCIDAYNYGGGEIKDWINPFKESHIKVWIKFYGNKEICYKQKFGNRNIWIQNKYKNV